METRDSAQSASDYMASGELDPAVIENKRRSEEWDTARKRWIDQNPIRKLRKKYNKMSQMSLAAGIGRGTLTIQYWEQGAVTPSPVSFEALANYFHAPNIAEEWRKWYERRPMPQQLEQESVDIES